MNGVSVASTIPTGKDATIYGYRRHGLPDDVSHNKLMHRAIIAQTEDEGQVTGFLRQQTAHFHTRVFHAFILVVNYLKIFTGKQHASTVN